ncbi:hypothetical protein ACFVSS_24440 [Peribacillus butanolivorans]|uniref:hypothetical protein n=1 Tax=Peribacillus butanolivorans TaxID=421767 RepID=UPI0036DA61E1
MYNYNYAFNPYNVPYYIDGERIPGPGGGQWDGHGGGHGGGQWDGHGGGHGGGHWEHGQWVPRCRRVWVHGFGWTWICRW